MDYLAFQVAGDGYGVSLLRVREISSCGPITRVPGAPPALRGVVSLRGRVIPVVDVAIRLGRPPTAIAPRTGMLYVDALVGGEPIVVGMIVDAIGGVRGFDPDDILPPPPALRLAEQGVLAGLGRLQEGFLPLLDVDGLVAPSRLAAAPLREEPAAEPEEQARAPGSRLPGAGDAAAATDTASRPSAHSMRPLPGEGTAPSPPRAPGRARRAVSPRPATPTAPASIAPPPFQAPRTVTRPTASRMPATHAPEATAPPRARSLGGRPTAWLGGIATGTVALTLLLYAASTSLGRRHVAQPPAHGDHEVVPVAARGREEPASADASLAPSSGQPSTRPTPTAGPPPAGAPRPAVLLHEVRRGDTLWALSRRYYGNPFLWPTIFASNRDRLANPDVISPRERLRVPLRP